MALGPGTSLGDYELVSLLGAGGMGQVFKARDRKLGRDVALKVLPEAFTSDPLWLARFEREARALASLNHANIATLHALEESKGIRFLVMELVPGETLAARIGRGPLPLEETLSLFQQIAEALEAAHEKGVVHRDLKPANINVTPEGQVKVLDFGLAKTLPEADSSDLSQSPTRTKGTLAGVILGTARYMSPEQARGKETQKATDIWSFGCCLFEALSRRPAFVGETVADLIGQILERDPEWQALPSTTPDELKKLLRRCLTKDLRHRLHDVADARVEIEEMRARPTKPNEADSHRRSLASRRVPAAVLMLLAAVAMGFLAWGLTRSASSPLTTTPPSRFVIPLGSNQSLAGTFLRGSANILALSPDGSWLAYVSEVGGNLELFLRAMDRLDAQAVPGSEGAMNPFFSPDGKWLGFFQDGGLKAVPIAGGVLRTICSECTGPVFNSGASWGHDDTIVFGVLDQGLQSVPASGGTPKMLTTPNRQSGERAHGWPRFLPDGKGLLFTVRTNGGSKLATLDPESGRLRHLDELGEGAHAQYLPSGVLVYGQSGKLMAVPFEPGARKAAGVPVAVLDRIYVTDYGFPSYALSESGTLAYIPVAVQAMMPVLVDREGRERSFTDESGVFEHPRFSPDGKKLAFDVRMGSKRDIWVYELERGTRSRYTFDGVNLFPAWTPDGERLAFASERGDSMVPRMYWQPADGSGEGKLLRDSKVDQLPSAWSPDGQILAYTEANPAGHYDIGMWPRGAEPAPFLASTFNEAWPKFSPDGRYVAYVSDESGRFEVYVRAYSGQAKWTVSQEGGSEPWWPRGGRELFYRRGGAVNQVIAVPVETEGSFKMGTPRVLFEGPYDISGVGDQHYDVSPDGREFAMLRVGEAAQVHVVLHWNEELKALVPEP